VLCWRDPKRAYLVLRDRSRAARPLRHHGRRRSQGRHRYGTRSGRRTDRPVRPTTQDLTLVQTSELRRGSGEAARRRSPALHLSATMTDRVGQERRARSTQTSLAPLDHDHAAPALGSLQWQGAQAEARSPRTDRRRVAGRCRRHARLAAASHSSGEWFLGHSRELRIVRRRRRLFEPRIKVRLPSPLASA
jgi:hypothetical protein